LGLVSIFLSDEVISGLIDDYHSPRARYDMEDSLPIILRFSRETKKTTIIFTCIKFQNRSRGGDKRRDLGGDKRGDRKKGRGKDEKHAVVKNQFPHGEIFMLVNETWAGDFAGQCNDVRPKWNERCKCCPRWFLQKYCFTDFPNAESHVEAEKVPPTILQQMLSWIKACRKN